MLKSCYENSQIQTCEAGKICYKLVIKEFLLILFRTVFSMNKSGFYKESHLPNNKLV